ncbi:unnamed protein product [Microthlaspi erraticum]|uniref:Disease resistance protein winged helix domain-containing protein n=1 Tax=Microthlaspi erraticum TaxID=1685480 RepID=A0A6D2J8I2_9BRAS|nr:unnamed protein product [Microthlaspi erraticum]
MSWFTIGADYHRQKYGEQEDATIASGVTTSQVLFPILRSISRRFLRKGDKLVDYWICEGFIDEKKGLRKAKNKAHGIIGTLVQACLLIEEGRDKSQVKMHDVVREMALWIANDFGKDEERCIVQAGVVYVKYQQLRTGHL